MDAVSHDFAWLAKLDPATTALIIVDVQNDFCEGGALAVPRASEIFSAISALRSSFSFGLTVLTKDAHPADHVSFWQNNEGAFPFQIKDLPEIGEQVMWPAHCVQGTRGAEFHPALLEALRGAPSHSPSPSPPSSSSSSSPSSSPSSSSSAELPADVVVVEKGKNRRVDSYSGFGDASEGHVRERTGLEDLLRAKRIASLVLVGLATDYCVSYTARDGARAGFDVHLALDGCRGISRNTVLLELEKMKGAGVHVHGDVPPPLTHPA
jgi:nicotinamidase/pyrazinamidase